MERLHGMRRYLLRFAGVLSAFFILYFLWRRLFIFGEDVFGVEQPRVRYMLVLAVVSTLVALIPSINKIIGGYIIQPVKAEFNKHTKPVHLLLIILSVLTGPNIAFMGLSGAVSSLSDIMMGFGAIVIVFLFSLFIASRVVFIGRCVRTVAMAFTDWRFIVAVLLLNVYAVIFLIVARQPFFWDNAGYWQVADYLSQMAFRSPVGFVRSVVGSIFSLDYHFLPAVIPAYVMALFNTSRMVFVLSVVNFYVVPFWALIYAVSAKTCGIKGFLAAIFTLVFVPFLAVVGFLDVGGIIFAFACGYLFFYTDEDGVISGLLLCATMMFRRWYVFFVIVFLVCAVIYALPVKERRRKLALMLFGFGTPMLLFFQGYVSGILLRDNFRDIYYAYSFTMIADVRFILRYFGVVLITGMLVYAIYAVWKKKGGFAAIFPLASCALIFFLFTAIQSFGMQHLLLFAPPVAIACIMASREQRLRIPVLIIGFMCFVSVFIPRAQPQTIQELRGFPPLPTFMVYPQVREDASELTRLDSYVRGLDGYTAVLASSFTLNSDLLALVSPSFNAMLPLNASERILHTAQVDRRDGLPRVLAYADYIVAAYPIQTHLDPGEQRVVVVPAEALLTGTPFAAAFTRHDTVFELRGGVTVYIFERIRPNTYDELGWLWDSIGLD